MPATITAKEQNLVRVFSDDYFFEIPLYQRPYAWTTEQVDQLLEDLTDEMNRDKDAPYFLGSVVLIKSESESRSQVVDGQQRVTTLTMLLCVLRELSSGDAAKDLDNFIREAGSPLKGTQDRFRLNLRERDRQFFQDNVQSRGKLADFLASDPVSFSDSQMRIFENVRYLIQKLSNFSESSRRDLAMYVVRNCYLVVVSASDIESAHRTFAVMNGRGLDLSATDILKANILGNMPTEAQDEYASKWEGIEESLGRDDFRDLFAHIRMIYQKTKPRRTLQQEFQDTVLSGEEENFVDDILEPYSVAYETVSRASYESLVDAEKVNGHLRHLGRLDNFDWIPPAMSYFRRNEGARTGILRFAQDLERLAYGLFIRREDINGRINRYARVLTAIEQGDDLFADNSPLQLLPTEKDDILNRLNGGIYNQPRIPMPLLVRLSILVADAGPGYVEPSATSIEHVLPQNPSDDSMWLDWFPDADERASWTHRLANLVLLSRRKNSQASNWDFERKRNTYFLKNGTTPFALTTRVVAETEWTPEVLERRQRELIDAFKKEWRLG